MGGGGGLVGFGDHQAVCAHIVERLCIVATAQSLDRELGLITGHHVYCHKSPVIGGDLELLVVELGPASPVVDGTTGRGHIDPQVLVVL